MSELCQARQGMRIKPGRPQGRPKGNIPKKLPESQNQPLARGPMDVTEVMLVAAED